MDDIVVIKITGKFFDNFDPELASRLISIIRQTADKYRIAVVTGGGNLARQYIGRAKNIGVNNNYSLDMIGIAVSRLNALLITEALHPLAPEKIPRTPWETRELLAQYSVVVLGGYIPGQSTAAVAIETAEAIGSDKVIDLSAIDKVYDKDPRKHPDAKPLSRVKASELLKLMEQKILPGNYQLLDRHAIDIMIRSKITVYITHYSRPENILDILKGKNPGTIITPE